MGLLLHGKRQQTAKEQRSRDRAEGKGKEEAHDAAADEAEALELFVQALAATLSPYGQSDHAEKRHADEHEQRPHQLDHAFLEERGQRRSAEQSPGDETAHEGVGQRAPDGVEQARKPLSESPAAAAEAPDVANGGDVRGQRTGADGGEQSKPQGGYQGGGHGLSAVISFRR